MATVQGSRKRGAEHVGKGNDSPGSELIIRLADEEDERPLWITVWGGSNTLAQAVWRVQQDRSEAELKSFLNKLRVYTITDQDRGQRTPFADSSHQWLRREFEKDLLISWDECAWKFQNGTGKKNWSEYETHIQGHGNLGKVYPKYKYGVEGDTPAFLHLMPNGLNDPSIPAHGGWGGYAAWGVGEDGDQLRFHWWVLSAAGTLKQEVEITNSQSAKATIDVPSDSAGKIFHVICEVTDDGMHNLSGYRRIIFEPTTPHPAEPR